MPREVLRDEVEHVELEVSQLEKERKELNAEAEFELEVDSLTFEIAWSTNLPYEEARKQALKKLMSKGV
jgi:hypothetical protein